MAQMKQEDIGLRSEEVQELMTQIPGRTLRWGTTIIFLFVISMLIGACFYKFPEVIRTDVIINSVKTKNKTIENSGVLSFSFIGSEKIKAGQIAEIINKDFPGQKKGVIKEVVLVANSQNTEKTFGKANLLLPPIVDIYKYNSMPDSAVYICNAKIIVGEKRLLKIIISVLNKKS
jgi:hypothetical protein